MPFWTGAELQKIYDDLLAKLEDPAETTRRFCKIFVTVSAPWLSKDEPDP